MSDDMKQWKDAWERHARRAASIFDDTCPGMLVEYMRDDAMSFLAIANLASGHGCKGCGGHGERMYGATSTWRGGFGGQAMTTGVCDVCWGTGRTDKKGLDRRRFERVLRAMEAGDDT